MHPHSSNLCCSRAAVNPQFNIYSIYIPNLTSLTSSTVPMVAQATTISHLDQGSANYNLWAKSGPTPICVNKVLLETAMFIHLHTVYGIFIHLQCRFESLLQKHYGSQSLKCSLSSSLQKKFANLCP